MDQPETDIAEGCLMRPCEHCSFLEPSRDGIASIGKGSQYMLASLAVQVKFWKIRSNDKTGGNIKSLLLYDRMELFEDCDDLQLISNIIRNVVMKVVCKLEGENRKFSMIGFRRIYRTNTGKQFWNHTREI